MTHKVNANWKNGLHFKIGQSGLHFDVDSTSGQDGQPQRLQPKPLMLSSLLGCTGMDVASLLKKMRVDYDRFELDVEGELTEEHPKYYKKVHVIYNFYGKELNQQKVTKSVRLSITRYCGVFEMFRQFAEVSHEINFFE